MLDELAKNPRKVGWIIMLRKARGESRVPVNLNLIDFKAEIDAELKDVIYKIRKKLGWYDDLPGGLK